MLQAELLLQLKWILLWKFKDRIRRLQILNRCVNPLYIYILYRCLFSRVLFPLSFANQCSDGENQLLSVSQVSHLFGSQRYYLQLLAPKMSHFFLFFQGSVFSFQFAQQNSLLYFKRPLNRAHTFLKYYITPGIRVY